MNKMGRPKGVKQARNESKYWLPEGVSLILGQTNDYVKDTKLQFLDSTYGEFTSYFKALQDANASTHPKAIQARKSATNLVKYGTEHAISSKTVRQKIENTFMSKYGVKNPTQNAEILQRAKDTFNINHNSNVNSPFGLKEIQDRSRQTLLRNHNVSNAAKLDVIHVLPNGKNIKEYCREKSVNSCMAYRLSKAYGLQAAQDWIDNHKSKISGLEVAALRLLPNLQRYEKCPSGVPHFKPDFILNNIYIDVDGLEYHSELFKDENEYHLRKRETYEKAGHRLLQFRQDEVILKCEIVKSIINSKCNIFDRKFRASELTFTKISKLESDTFLNKTHLMGTTNGVSAFGLKDKNNNLLCVMTTKIKEREMEIVRFSSELNTQVYGGLSKLLNKIKV